MKMQWPRMTIGTTHVLTLVLSLTLTVLLWTFLSRAIEQVVQQRRFRRKYFTGEEVFGDLEVMSDLLKPVAPLRRKRRAHATRGQLRLRNAFSASRRNSSAQ